MTPHQVWVDTDIALGGRRGDVDDGFALAAVAMAARKFPDAVELLGVSAVAGNTTAAIAETCATQLLQVCGMGRIPVVAAADAAESIARLPARSSIVALGPLSNVSAALHIDSGLATRCRLSAVAGVLDHWRHPLLGAYCLNTRFDPDAARHALAAPFQSTRLFPLDVVRRLHADHARLDELQGLGAVGAYLSSHSRRWARQSWWRYSCARFPLWDLVAALASIQRLPGAQWSANGHQLLDFDAPAAWTAFCELLRD